MNTSYDPNLNNTDYSQSVDETFQEEILDTEEKVADELRPDELIKQLQKIDPSDKISSLIKKINDNFTTIAEFGGGFPGKDGKDGDRGFINVNDDASKKFIEEILKKHTIVIHDNEDSDSDSDELNNWLEQQDLMDGQLVIDNSNNKCNLYYVNIENGKKTLKLFSELKGKDGLNGENAENITFPVISGNNKHVILNNKVAEQGIILDISEPQFINEKNDFGSDIETNADINGYQMYSLKFTRTDDGIAFYKNHGLGFEVESKITHNTYNDNTKSSFNISDNSTDGIKIYSHSGDIVLKIHDDDKKLDIYSNNINISKNNENESTLKINNFDEIDINAKKISLYNDYSRFFLNDENIKLTSKNININERIKIDQSNIIFGFGNSVLSLTDKNASFNSNSTTISANEKIFLVSKNINLIGDNKDNGSVTDTDINLSGSLNVSKDLNVSRNLTVYNKFNIDNNNLYLNNKRIDDIYANKSNGLSQFVTKTYSKKRLRDEIGAIGFMDLSDDTISDTTPIGTVIMSISKTRPSSLYLPCDVRYNLKKSKDGIIRVVSTQGLDVSEYNDGVDANTYKKLWDMLRDAYGYESDTYVLPDFNGRFPMGVSYNNNPLSYGGSNSLSLSIENLPEHYHVYGSNEWGSRGKEQVTFVNNSINCSFGGSDNDPGYWRKTLKSGIDGGKAMSSKPINITPPYILMCFYIKARLDKNEESNKKYNPFDTNTYLSIYNEYYNKDKVISDIETYKLNNNEKTGSDYSFFINDSINNEIQPVTFHDFLEKQCSSIMNISTENEEYTIYKVNSNKLCIYEYEYEDIYDEITELDEFNIPSIVEKYKETIYKYSDSPLYEFIGGSDFRIYIKVKNNGKIDIITYEKNSQSQEDI